VHRRRNHNIDTKS